MKPRLRVPGAWGVVACLASLMISPAGPLTGQVRPPPASQADEAARILLGAGVGVGLGGVLAGLAGEHTFMAEATGFLGGRVSEQFAILAEVGFMPTPLQDPLSDRELTTWRVMVGLQAQSGGWLRPSVGWLQGSWSGEGDAGGDGGPALGLALGGLPWELGGGWHLGVEGFTHWGWIGPERSIHTRAFGVRGLLMRR